ncbi:MAG TPA: protein meaA [Ornithinibacter sp.]|uniref:protein meaA n=1 Tax=Ornithinibacter sp. TaxID=2862748 RepID=UPI001B6119F3|nr:protein meaA [Ornithinibacter sp.]MBP6524216.1 protein meaA [Dermatophilaceae bacterium]MBU9943284.1 protein meaA [Dermatophilaceae bacterium]HOB79412.1 protein meaA [Ornithinibacter sp.]HQA15016.1 protein meaA [Ornithinibacter sp.]HQG17493.1 protein meaA [Ornithinibacter sp.]
MPESTDASRPPRDRPWVMRTYAGHSSAAASNALYRRNLDKGQTGLSVAFDLPTQTGYDPDHVLARGEVGKVGVPISHIGDMRALFADIPLSRMNTSMTINATAMWLLALYQVAAEEQAEAAGEDPASAVRALAGTTQNDIIKEYLSRGTYVFAPGPSLRLITDMVTYTVTDIPKWNPINICSYHLQEAGATPVQEIAYAMCTAIAVLDAVRDSGQVPPERFGEVVARISFFVNAGVRFVEEMCKMRAFVQLWDELTRERYGVTDDKARRFRYGVQVNSLGLTEAQPENNVQRIVLEMLAVTLSKDARARAVQLPAWNEALGLPRPWDQQWSLRIQQVLAYESDLLEYDDLFEGSTVVAAKVAELVEGARAEIDRVQAMGGAVPAVEGGYMKSELVASHSRRRQRIELGEDVVVGVNAFETTEPNPLTADLDAAIQSVDPGVEAAAVAAVRAWRDERDADPARRERAASALARLKADATSDVNLMAATLECARAGLTTGEWAGALREVFGEFRAPTGVSGSVGVGAGSAALTDVRAKVAGLSEELGEKLRVLVGKPGLDGHSNGAEQVAVRARDAGFEVIYQGIRLTPEQIVAAAVAEDVHLVGISILSGSHMELVPEVLDRLREAGAGDVPVIVGGIIPEADAVRLKALGVAEVFTPKDFGLNDIMSRFVDVIRVSRGLAADAAAPAHA